MSLRMDYKAASPEGMKALGAVHSYVAQSGLSPTLVELVYLRISQMNGCAYCVDDHSRALLRAGTPAAKLALVPVWQESGPWFDEAERAALSWAEIVTRVAKRGVPDRAYEAAAAVFEQKQLADLTIAIGLMNAYNRIAVSFGAGPAIPPA